ncbi:MAG TPA: protein phosphatase CheZ [Pseudomonadales bacterium]|nr:protein phosphatase CheZ [Pseudomonadales bacterium]
MLEGRANQTFEGSLMDHAKDLLTQLETGNAEAAMRTIETLHQARDWGLYHEIGKLTRSLHDAIMNFHIHVNIDGEMQKEMSRMADASDRLGYVIKLTEKAANRTMDMVEETVPLSAELGRRASELHQHWQRLIRRELKPEEFRELSKQMDAFLEYTAAEAGRIDSNLNNILLAQDFQDLTGQVIKRVITLVQEVEDSLVNLVKVASRVENMTGIKYVPTHSHVESIEAEGPIVNAEQRDDVVKGQDDVDALLSSLGF